VRISVVSWPGPRNLGTLDASGAIPLGPVPPTSLGAIALPLQGPQGPPGPPGASGAGYVHQQIVPSSTWTIAHNLGFYPSVTVASPGGVEVEVEVVHISTTLTEIRLLVPFTGTARLS
jgi:hypothetical protein